MSAWLCSDKHIFELAAYYTELCQQYESSKMTFKEVAKLLYKENCKSLAERYGDEDTPISVPATYTPTVRNIFELAKLVDCYSYQSNEHDQWEASKAREICDSIKYHLFSNHPDYESAGWGID